MKAILEFDRPEDDEAICHALAGAKYYEVLCEFDLHLEATDRQHGNETTAALLAVWKQLTEDIR